MRFFILLAAVLMIPAFAVVMEWRYQSGGQRDELLMQCRNRLNRAGLDKVTVTLDHFDAQLGGTCTDPSDRDTAQNLVTSLRGLRVLPADNRIRVPAKLFAALQGSELRLSGWLPTDARRAEVLQLAQDTRPDMKATGDDIRLSAHVEMGPDGTTQEGRLPLVFVNLLESIRLPASLSISGSGRRYELKGSLPSSSLREAVIEAAKDNGHGFEIDARQLMAHEHVATAPFAEGDSLADFVRSFFRSPMPGTFQIDKRNGPRVVAYATAEMESEWLTLLRPVTGAARVKTEITREPSIYHFPGYQPESNLPHDVAEALRETFRSQTVQFDPGSSHLKPEEEAKLGPLADAVIKAGDGLHAMICGSADVGGEPGTAGKALQKARIEGVRAKLVQMGVHSEALEDLPVDPVRSSGPVTDDMRRSSRSVELLIK